MYRWLLAFILSTSLTVHADNVLLIPVSTPPPVYPLELSRTGITGSVKVKFTVNSDGSVSDVLAIKRTHMLLAIASVKAVRQWRFKPWVASSEQPSQIEIRAPMIFTRNSDRQLPMDINATLRDLPCSKVNAQVAHRDRYQPDKPLHELSVFSYVVIYLSEGVMSTQIPDEQRTSLVSELNREIPAIVERCQEEPTANYAEQLPEGIQILL